MSKILRRCLSLVLVVMLLASLTISGSLTASADNKTGDGLAAYAMNAYNEGWKYVWGGASYGAVDCSGLIYSYVGSGARVTEDMLYSSPESGYVSDGVPDIPGLGLCQPGHVGVYVGGGMAVDARDEISNVCYQSVSTKSWVMWFKVAGVSYGNDTSVANDDQSAEADTGSSKTAADSDSKAEPEPTVLSQGSRGPEVRELQARLKELGYFDEDTTEYFGPVTYAALVEFQTAAGLNADGVYDEATKAALFSNDAPVKSAPEKEDSDNTIEGTDNSASEEEDVISVSETEIQSIESDLEAVSASEETQQSDESGAFAEFSEYQPAVTDSDESEASEEEELPADAIFSVGDDDSEISNIQYILVKLGYFDYAITGYYCENTAAAVEEFRVDNGLDAVGYIDSTTLDLIYSKWNGDDITDSEISVTDSAESVEVVYDPDNLSLGMSGQRVEDLQRTLVVWGYLSYADLSERGTFDEATENAVITAQRNFGLEESGVVTEEFVKHFKSSDENVNVQEVKNDVEPSSQESSSESSSAESASAESSQTSVTSDQNLSQTVSNDSSSQNVAFVQTGIEDYFTKTVALIVIAVSLVVIFFAGTVHYWNVSMEKRRQRARKATTVSAYRRRSM